MGKLVEVPMDELVKHEKVGKLTRFDPKTTKIKDIKADALIDYAKNIKDWPLLEQAVAVKIEEQRQFVEWWHKNVTRPGGDQLEQRKVGWTLDDTKHCDLIAYAISGLNKCYLLPFELLRITAKANLEKWKTVERMYPKDAPNHDKQTGRFLYYTRNCAVSWDRLFFDMQWQMQRRFGSTELQLPTAVTIEASNQLNFIWGGPENAIHKNQRQR